MLDSSKALVESPTSRHRGRPRFRFPELEGKERKNALQRYYVSRRRDAWNHYQKEWRKTHADAYNEQRRKFNARHLAYLKSSPERWAHHLSLARANAKAQYARYRQMYSTLLGDECYCCGSKGPLEVHHLSYPNGKHFNAHKTFKEVRDNPWNFKRLCFKCHMAITHLTSKQTAIPKIIEVVKATRVS